MCCCRLVEDLTDLLTLRNPESSEEHQKRHRNVTPSEWYKPLKSPEESIVLESWKVFLQVLFLVQCSWQHQNKCDFKMILSTKLFSSKGSSCGNDGQTSESFELKLRPPKIRSVSKPSKCLWRCRSMYLFGWVLELPPPFLLGSGQFSAQFKWPQTRLCGRRLVKQQHTEVQELLGKGWNALTQLVHLALGWHLLFPAQRALALIAHHEIPKPCSRVQTIAGETH